MHQATCNGLGKRESYGDIATASETATEQTKYLDRQASVAFKSPYISSSMNASTLEIEEQQEQMNKQHLLQAAIKQMSANTKTDLHK